MRNAIPNLKSQISNPKFPRGLTLMELLVVIFLVGLITAVTIPVMNPQSAPRRIREGSRIVSGAFSVARNRAVAEGRSVGVWLERQPAPKDSACFKLFFAEQPPTYSGETLSATVKVDNKGIATFTGINAALINDGDVLQINYQGHFYRMIKSGGGYALSSVTSPGGTAPITPVGVAGLPFQIFRQPVKSAEKPIQLPSGIAIDLGASGFNGLSAAATGTSPLIVMFTPGGAVNSVVNLTAAGGPSGATDTLFLLVGRSDGLVQVYPNDPTNNQNDPGTIWVAVGNQTGMVSTVENNGLSNGKTDIITARTYAQTRTSMGGR